MEQADIVARLITLERQVISLQRQLATLRNDIVSNDIDDEELWESSS